MLTRLPRQPADLGRDREAQADRVARRRIGILPDDQHPHVGERLAEGAEDVLACRQVAAAGSDLGSEEVAELR